jgi:trk system potassium uptake protein TrkA
MAKFAVIGLGIFGSTLARSLSKSGAEVIAIDIDKKKVEDVMDYVTSAVTLIDI